MPIESLAYRKREPTPYMEGLRFLPNGDRDADERVLSDDELHAAEEAGKGKIAHRVSVTDPATSLRPVSSRGR